ncbi:MAG: DUF932 domain-containing protein [Myxococcales bacterium]|nr:DUF932 domain-containing protein [Myxococcales bacterium]
MSVSHPANDDASRPPEESGSRRLQSFDDVLAHVEDRDRRKLPDEVVHLSDLEALEGEVIRLPNGTELALNSWSQRQLGSLLGIRWDRFFENTTPSERAEQITTRLRRTTESKKLRAYAPMSSGDRGELRAILAPSFTAIDDIRVFAAMKKMVSGALARFAFLRVEVTDSATFYHAISRESVSLDGDELHPGFMLRNSETGGSALSIDDAWFRKVCSNGLMLQVGGKRALYRTHRRIETETLESALVLTIARLPERWTAGMHLLNAARHLLVKHPSDAIEAMLDDASIPRELVRTAQGLAVVDRATSAYDIVQSVTRAAHEQNRDPHLRFQLERLAGEYLVQNVKLDDTSFASSLARVPETSVSH